MWKRFMQIMATIWQLSFYTNLVVFQMEICHTLFKRYLLKNVALDTPTFYMKMNHFNIVFHIT